MRDSGMSRERVVRRAIVDTQTEISKKAIGRSHQIIHHVSSISTREMAEAAEFTYGNSGRSVNSEHVLISVRPGLSRFAWLSRC